MPAGFASPRLVTGSTSPSAATTNSPYLSPTPIGNTSWTWSSEERDVRVAAYLMSNHFHLVAVGDRQDAISHVMMQVNGQYATYRNATQRTPTRPRPHLAKPLLLLRPR